MENQVQNVLSENITNQILIIPEEYKIKWQETINVLSELFETPIGMITQNCGDYLQIITTNTSPANFYTLGMKKMFSQSNFCKDVILSKKEVEIENASNNIKWADYQEVRNGVISYLGLPLLFPDGNCFGSLCVIDYKSRTFASKEKKVMYEFKKLIESDIKYFINSRLSRNEELQQENIELQRKEEQFSRLLEILPICVVIHSKGKIVYLNQYAVNTFKAKNKDEYIGKEAIEFVHPDFRNIVRQRILSSQLNKEVAPLLEEKFITAEGKTIDVLVASLPAIFNNQPSTLVVIQDITDQKNIQRELEATKELYQILFEMLADPTFLIEKETGNILELNSAAISIYGYTKEEALKMSNANFSAEPDDTRKALLGRATQVLLRWHKRKTGVVFPVEIKGSNFRWKGKDIQIAVCRDITDRIETEKELIKAKEKAEESDRLKSAFLANMSHEIRTPMNGIIGFADLLSEPGLPETERRQFLDIIKDSSNHLLGIVNNIIDISKIEAGLLEISRTNLCVNELLKDIHSFYQPTAIKNGIELLIDSTLPDESSFIETDPIKVKQIFNNLISNSLKFTSSGYVKYGYSVDRNYLKFYVKDTGVGIPDDFKDAVFDRFRQAKNNLIMTKRGTGLGLSISKALVELLGGKIWFETIYGTGTSFYFTLPYINNSVNELQTNIKEDGKLNSGSPVILVVEDEELNYLFVEEVLIRKGFKVLHARTAEEAISIYAKHTEIKVVLMDIKLPDINGYDLTKLLLKIRTVPIIAQTAYAMAGDREKALESGCVAYIPKPIKKDELLNLLYSNL